MKVLGFDIETTGLNEHVDNIIELAFVLWDVEGKKPINMGSFLIYQKAVSPKITQITGITQEMLDNFGVSQNMASSNFLKHAKHAEAYVAHNGINFDIPFMQKMFRIEGLQWKDLPVIDTRTDLPFPQEVASRKMEDIAPVHGIINPFAHRALTDTLVMLEILSQYDIQNILDTVAVSPFVTITSNKYVPDGFWAWKEHRCYQRRARQVYAYQELDILKKKHAGIKFEIVV